MFRHKKQRLATEGLTCVTGSEPIRIDQTKRLGKFLIIFQYDWSVKKTWRIQSGIDFKIYKRVDKKL